MARIGKYLLAISLLLGTGSAKAQSITSQPFAQQADPTASIRFASGKGSDSNNCINQGTACASIYTALEKLPGGSANPPTAGRGIVYVLDGSAGTSCALMNPFTSPTVGLGLMDFYDPNYASPPNGWLRSTGWISVIGITGDTGGSLSTGPSKVCVTILGTQPTTALALIGNGLDFENLSLPPVTKPVTLGYNSNGINTGGNGTAGVGFTNNLLYTSQTGSSGPTMTVGQNVFQVYMDRNNLAADCNQTPGADNAANILFNAGAGGMGMPTADFGFRITNEWWYCGGGVKYYAQGTFATISMKDVDMEGTAGFATNANPGFWLVTGSSLGINIQSGQLQDYTAPTPYFRNDTGNGSAITVINVHGNTVDVQGAADSVLGADAAEATQTISPLQWGQSGIFRNRITGLQEAPKRTFSPVAVRFTNLATTNAPSWTNSGNTTFTSAITAPDGTTGAGQFVSTSGIQQGYLYPQSGQALSVGDFLIGGAWVRSQTANGYDQGIPLVIISNSSGTNAVLSCMTLNPLLASGGDGSWEWVYEVCKVTTGSTGSNDIALYAYYDTTHTLQVYGPVFNYIASGTVSANEVYAYANGLVSYDHSCAVGTVCGLGSQSFVAKVINGVSYSQNYPGATLDVRVNAAMSDAESLANGNTSGIVDSTGEGGAQTIAAQITVGDGTHPVTWKLPRSCAWSATSGIGSTHYAIFQNTFTNIEGLDASSYKCLITNNSGALGIEALFGNAGVTSSVGYYHARGFGMVNAVTTGSGAVWWVNGNVDVTNYDHIGVSNNSPTTDALLLGNGSQNCCAAHFDHLELGSNYVGGTLLAIVSNNSGVSQRVSFTNSSFTHPAASTPIISIIDTSTDHNCSVQFENVYEETSNTDTTTAINQVAGCGSILVNGMSIEAFSASASTATGWTISNAQNTSFQINNFEMGRNFTSPVTMVVNNFSGQTVTAAISGGENTARLSSYMSNPPLATASSLGYAECDGTTTTCANGVITATSTASAAFSALTASINTNTGSFGFSAAGAASTPTFELTGVPFAGNGTTSIPYMLLGSGGAATTWNANGTYLGFNAASGFTGNFLEFHLNGGASLAFINDAGSFSTTGVVQVGTSGTYGWASSTLLHNFSNGAAGVENSSSVAGKWEAGALQIFGTTFTASGCSNGTLVGGATAGSYDSGTSGTCTVVVTMGNTQTAANGWGCSVWDITTNADLQEETAYTTTTVTFSGTTASGDKIAFSCIAF